MQTFFPDNPEYTELSTTGYHFKTLVANASNMQSYVFNVRAPNDAIIALNITSSKWYEVVIGGWANKKSVIRLRNTARKVLTVRHGKILDNKVFKDFWVSWKDKVIRVGKCFDVIVK